MRKLISILLVLAIAISLVACTENKVTTIVEDDVQKPSTETTVPDETTHPSEPDEPVVPPTNNTVIIPEMTEYKEEYQNYQEISSFMASASIISFPSSIKPTENSVKEFSTKTEFSSYLDTYCDLQDNSNDEINITENGFYYNHGFCNYLSSGYKNRFFFISNEKLSAKNVTAVNKIVYREESKSLYILMKTEDTYFTDWELNEEIVTKIEEQSVSSYGIVFMHIDEEYLKNVEKIYFVLSN